MLLDSQVPQHRDVLLEPNTAVDTDSQESLSDFYIKGAKPLCDTNQSGLVCPVCRLSAQNVKQLQDHLHQFHS